MTKKTSALKTLDSFNFPTLSGDVKTAMEEEMDGLQMSFPQIKIPSGGGLTFEVPGEDPESPDAEKEITGIIIDHHPVNAYWKDRNMGANNPPDCSSMDGRIGIDQNGNPNHCDGCPLNVWGTAEDGRGKACKNMRRIYILKEGEALPYLLTLPPTSLKNITDYIGLRIVSKGLRSYGVITKIGLKKVQNSGGINYSQATFSLAGMLSPEQTKLMKKFSEEIKLTTRKDKFAAGFEQEEVTTVEYDDVSF